MDQIYLKIFKLARPYYEKGRPYDIPHVEWMMEKAQKIAPKLDLNEKILYPLIILHDVGYSAVNEANPDIKDSNFKRIHMVEGAKIAKKILRDVDFDPELSEKIVYYVSVHDNWVFSDDEPFKECIEMAFFNDLDFAYAQSDIGILENNAQSMGIGLEDMYDFWINDEKLTRRPFCCKETQEIFNKNMEKFKKELEENKKIL